MPRSKVVADAPVFAVKAELFKTLGHPLRIRALEVLSHGEQSVGELAELTETDPAHLSQQLAVLRRASLVSTRREGTTVFYAIKDPLLIDVLEVARRYLIASLRENQSLLTSLRAARRL
jgi:ArsR family transcriptional regulator